MIKEVEKIAFEIIANEDKYVNDYSLASGKAGISLFLYNAGLYCLNEAFVEKASQYFEDCLYSSAEETNKLNHSLYGGTTGVYWLFQYYINEGFIDKEEYKDVLLAYDATLIKTCEYWTSHKNYDLLYGLLGASVYYFERQKTIDALQYLEKIASMLTSFSLFENNMRWWNDQQMVDASEYEKTNIVNLGFAHGLPSLISFFSKIYSVSKLTKHKDIVVEIYNYLVHTCGQAYVDVGSFPYRVIDGVPQPGHSRLAWCYGDLTIGYSLLSSGKRINDLKMQEFGTQVLEKLLNRKMDDSETGVVDSSFCHGISGIVYVLKCADKLQSSDNNRNGILYWESELVKFKLMNGVYSTMLFDRVCNQFHAKLEYGYLEGIAGVGMSLLPASQINFELINLIK